MMTLLRRAWRDLLLTGMVLAAVAYLHQSLDGERRRNDIYRAESDERRAVARDDRARLAAENRDSIRDRRRIAEILDRVEVALDRAGVLAPPPAIDLGVPR